MQPQAPNDEEKQEKLDQDYDPPFSLPADVGHRLDPTDPRTDGELDSQELYDAGADVASGAEDAS